MSKFRYLVTLLLLVVFLGLSVGTVSAEDPSDELLSVLGVEPVASLDGVPLEPPKGMEPIETELMSSATSCASWTSGAWYQTCSLYYGERNNQVRAIQIILNCAGISAGPTDGIFGPQTQAAVNASQLLAGWPASGFVGEATWAMYQRRLVPVGYGWGHYWYKVQGCEAYGSLFAQSSTGRWMVLHAGSGEWVPMSRDHFNPG